MKTHLLIERLLEYIHMSTGLAYFSAFDPGTFSHGIAHNLYEMSFIAYATVALGVPCVRLCFVTIKRIIRLIKAILGKFDGKN